MTKRQSDNKTTKQVRIDAGMHRLLKIKSAELGRTIRELLEEALTELLAIKNDP